MLNLTPTVVIDSPDAQGFWAQLTADPRFWTVVAALLVMAVISFMVKRIPTHIKATLFGVALVVGLMWLLGGSLRG